MRRKIFLLFLLVFNPELTFANYYHELSHSCTRHGPVGNHYSTFRLMIDTCYGIHNYEFGDIVYVDDPGVDIDCWQSKFIIGEYSEDHVLISQQEHVFVSFSQSVTVEHFGRCSPDSDRPPTLNLGPPDTCSTK